MIYAVYHFIIIIITIIIILCADNLMVLSVVWKSPRNESGGYYSSYNCEQIQLLQKKYLSMKLICAGICYTLCDVIL